MLNRLKDVFKSLQKHEVKYLVIGGIASIIHGVPRATFDLDILIDSSLENARRLLTAFTEAGLGSASLTTPEAILTHDISIFNDWVRIDVQTSTPGLNFQKAWEGRNTINYQGQNLHVVSKGDLIASKKASGRDIDMQDVKLLELPEK